MPLALARKKAATRRYVLAGTAFFCAIVLALLVGIFASRRSSEPADLSSPTFALAKLPSDSLYYNRAAARWLPAALRNHSRAADFGRAERDPPFWRQLDRQVRFKAIFLSGDPGDFRPLLQHLRESKDWVLTHVDHVSFIFARAPHPSWTPDQLAALKEKFASFPAWQRALFLGRLAGNLLEIEESAIAKSCIDEALALDKKSAEVWNELAIYDAHSRRWIEALAHADRALQLDRNYNPALSVKAQALLFSGRASEAFDVSSRSLKLKTHDPAALFLHAKIAHQARAFEAEIAALRSLIELAERDHVPAAGYRIYLAQAYAANGKADPALDEFQKALASGEITNEQQAFIEESMRQIKTRVPFAGNSQR